LSWVPPEKRNIGMVFQEGALFPHLTVSRNVGYGLVADAAAEDKVKQVLELVGLPDLANRYPDELSGGQRQRVALARALAPEPRLVLLDEPFASLDAGLRRRLRDDVRRILRQAGATAVLVTHDREEALSIADRLAVMVEGRILQVGPPAEIYHRPESVEVACFMGEGHLVACHIEAGEVWSPFGRVATTAADGPVYLYLRPEDLGIEPAEHAAGAHGRIVDRRFFGHDVLDRVRLESGEELEVRVLSSLTLPEGSPVTLTLQARDFSVFDRLTNDG
ncbi:MAG: ABC transporter ATP-binding protein, partial [Acidobacteriota bacterium]|nr:ABC transporter ATP-binding protein [Acidobacteriota bacterium]